ncbi:Retron-type RNA-directed DNA polymerase [uncultured Leptolyngbya sp.]|uniref:Retron-type RNA-directed DNA polymerase n=1 Tax=uncultured Leptolyngbya sp. TaxID=332963 RepID=A0A6J4KW64_9CYAN|nr:Retron-type RNA-directed DNA polymerase [uncultured Leptolyngbya sp.]
MNPVLQPRYEWKTLPWKQIQRRVFKLQKRLDRASCCGNVKAVHKLQRLLLKAWSARCLAVRRVTQDNAGKKTAGIDGVASLPPTARLRLVASLKLGVKAAPARRVWIPKPGSAEQRPLGILTMHDRALQALVKLALEPEWEAKFEPGSYGFRPGRSAHDALQAIDLSLTHAPKYVLDADLWQCFNRINQTALLQKLHTFPALRRQIKRWLQAGVIDQEGFSSTDAGTQQGGVISPLLCNVALHGLETMLKQQIPTKAAKLTVVRFADACVVLHQDRQVIQQCQQRIVQWLQPMGLELKPSKTRLCHTLTKLDGRSGFALLGFEVRQYPVGQTHSKQGFKTLIKPSQTATQRHLQQLRDLINHHKAAPQAAFMRQLNPVIWGWSAYYAAVCSKELYQRVDWSVWQKLWPWARRRHPNKSRGWVAHKYWRRPQGRRVFASVSNQLRLHRDYPIRRHIKVKGVKTPFDGDWLYWSTRLGEHPDTPRRVARLLKQQRGKCAVCGLYFQMESLLEIDHIIPKALGGKDEFQNWQLLHRHCHDVKSAVDGSHPSHR